MFSKSLITIFVLFLAAFSCAFPRSKLTKSTNDGASFGLALLDALEQQHGGVWASENLIISPVALQNILLMLDFGADGQTLKQIDKVIGNFSLFDQLRIQPTDYFQIFNALAVHNSYPINEYYINHVEQEFNAQVFKENFKTRNHVATIDLNSWIADQTKGGVSEFFAHDLDPKTKMVMLNAVHYMGTWDFTIFAQFTSKAPFQLTSGAQKQVDMMQAFVYLKYAQFDDGELLEFPIRDQGLSMLAFLPNQSYIETAKSFSSLFGSMPLSERLAKLNDGIYTYLYLPRFQTGQTAPFNTSLKIPLQQLGITDAFIEGQADFSGIEERGKDLYLSDVVHQVALQWNEVGTKADSGVGGQAESDLGAGGGIFPTMPTITMTFNRPFLYLVMDQSTIIFAGVAHNP